MEDYLQPFSKFVEEKLEDILVDEQGAWDIHMNLSASKKFDDILFYGDINGISYNVFEEVLSYAKDFDLQGTLIRGLKFECLMSIDSLAEYSEDEDAELSEEEAKKIYMKEGKETLLVEMQIDGKVLKSLEKKADENYEKFGVTWKKMLSVIKKVFKRGVGAFRTNPQSVRPHIKKLGATAGAIAWGHSRVNAFLKKGKGTWGGADKDLADEIKKAKK